MTGRNPCALACNLLEEETCSRMINLQVPHSMPSIPSLACVHRWISVPPNRTNLAMVCSNGSSSIDTYF